jgi:hypothetical protein
VPRVRISPVLKTIFLSIFTALSFATVSAQQPPPAAVAVPAESAWINGAPADAGFSVLMPGKPSERTQAVEGHPGVENHLLMLETTLAGYVVSYVVFPDVVTDPASIKDLLDRGREGGLASSGATLKSEKEIKLKDYPGREWEMELPGGLSATARAYWVRRRLFQTVFITTPKSDDSAEVKRLRHETATKFLDSFTLSDDAGK